MRCSPHPNADLLSIIPVFGYTYVGRTQDWTGVTKGAYIPPDSIVDATRPEFMFLIDQAKGDGKVRIKAKKLRGVVSFGLMVPVPDDTELGEDWAERLGVEHYEPPLAVERDKTKGPFGSDEAPTPPVYAPKYDLDNFRRYSTLFEAGEPVVVTEKLDGANARYTCIDGVMHCGSRTRWIREFVDYSHLTVDFLIAGGCEPEKAEQVFANLTTRPQKRNIWWQALQNYSAIEEFCRANPGTRPLRRDLRRRQLHQVRARRERLRRLRHDEGRSVPQPVRLLPARDDPRRAGRAGGGLQDRRRRSNRGQGAPAHGPLRLRQDLRDGRGADPGQARQARDHPRRRRRVTDRGANRPTSRALKLKVVSGAYLETYR